MRSIIVADAPTRLDFGGGWTDVPPYPEERGGFVCNIAIERRATVHLQAAPAVPRQRSVAQSSSEPPALVAIACRAADVRDIVAKVTSNFPVGAGLGGSSAVGVALAAALARWKGVEMSLSELAEWSRAVEVSGLQIAGGYQDHYAAAHGGALALSFDAVTRVRPIALLPATIEALETRCTLLYTGESRISGETISAVLDAYQRREPTVLHALNRMKELARLMADTLAVGNISELGHLIGEHWEHQRALHPRITTNRIDAIATAAYSAGALGLKALGASGGGCVLIVAPEDGADRVNRAVAALGEPLEWSVALTGVRVREELPLSPAGATG